MTLGSGVLLLGAYVILVAGTRLLLVRFRFQSYRLRMRTLIILWWITIAVGVPISCLAWLTTG
jgi:hypothetical protein